QELIMPRFAQDLAKSHDDDGKSTVHVTGRYDGQNVYIHGVDADRATRTLFPFWATIPKDIFGSIRDIKGQQATYIPPDHPTAPLKGGWLVRRAVVSPLIEEELLGTSDVLRHVDDLKSFPKSYKPTIKNDGQLKPNAKRAQTFEPINERAFSPHSEYACFAAFPSLPPLANLYAAKCYALLDRKFDVGRGTYFLKTNLTFQAMTRKTNWYQFAMTRDLMNGLIDPVTGEGSERNDMAMFVHVRLLRPLLGMNLLFMTLPLVLGGYGRNTFINLGLALGNSAMFYGGAIFCQYLGSFRVISPALAAW